MNEASLWLVTGDKQWEDVKETVLEEVFTPELNLLKDIKSWGPDAQAAGYVLPHHVVALQEAGIWDDFVHTFNVQPVAFERRRAGEPTFNGHQYAFGTKDDYNRYLAYQTMLVFAGLQRTINDYTKVLISAGRAPEGSEMKRLGAGKWVLVAGSVQTPMRVPTTLEARARATRDIMRELNALAK